MEENKEIGTENGSQQSPYDQQSSYGQSIYEQPGEQTFEQQTYSQSEPQTYGQQSYSQQTYSQPEQQTYGQQSYSQQTYSQSEPQTYGQQSYSQQTYSQPEQQTYGQQTYNQTGYGMGAGNVAMGNNGRPLKNNFGMKLTFSILEILCCCGCNIITMIMGIIGCVFTTQANTAYKEGRWDDFKAKSKTSTILLWVGFGFAVLSFIINIFAWTVGGVGEEFMDSFQKGFEAGYNSALDTDDEEDDYNNDYGSEPETETEMETETRESEAEEVEPVNVISGDGYTDPTIVVNGVTLTFPISYEEFVTTGFYIASGDEGYVLNKNEYFDPVFYDANGTAIGYVYIGNESEEPLPLKDSVVFGVDITTENGDVTFSLPNGLNANATAQDFMTAFGEPDDEYVSEENDYQSYQWYNHNDEYYDAEENSITVEFWDGMLDGIEMKYIGWD